MNKVRGKKPEKAEMGYWDQKEIELILKREKAAFCSEARRRDEAWGGAEVESVGDCVSGVCGQGLGKRRGTKEKIDGWVILENQTTMVREKI